MTRPCSFPRLRFPNSTCTLPPLHPPYYHLGFQMLPRLLLEEPVFVPPAPHSFPFHATSYSSPTLPRSLGISVTSSSLAGRTRPLTCAGRRTFSAKALHTIFFTFFFLRFHALQCRPHTYPDLTVSGLPIPAKSPSQTNASITHMNPWDGPSTHTATRQPAGAHLRPVRPCRSAQPLAHVLFHHFLVACLTGDGGRPNPKP